MTNKTIKIERFYSDGINENTSKIKNVVKIIKPEEIAELKEKIPTFIKEKEVRKAHIKRVSKQECDVKSGLYYIDVVSHFTRIGDHARNLVEKMIENKTVK